MIMKMEKSWGSLRAAPFVFAYLPLSDDIGSTLKCSGFVAREMSGLG
jgi:hypothetical protein